MATVIERPGTRVVEERTFYDSDNSGWAVALVVLVVLALIALFAWPSIAQRAAPISPSTIQVNVPNTTPAATTPVQNSTLPVDNGSTPPAQP